MSHPHEHSADSVGDIRVAFLLNVGFAAVEIVGGLLTNSLAILSDALHDLGDGIALGLAWLLERHSHRAGDTRYSYGYRRYSLLAALLNTAILIGGSLFILAEAIPRLLSPEHSNAQGMILLALGGILVNGAAALRLRRGQTMNAQVAAWHLLEDVLGWVAVLIVGVVLLFADVHILDPILAMLISLYVLANVLRRLRQTAALFMQAVPETIALPELEHALQAIQQVQSVHHTHVWSLDGAHHVLTTHLVVDAAASKADLVRIKQQVGSLTRDMAFEHTTIELEYEDEECLMDGPTERPRAAPGG
jgi:cobalt-zinc-cadmium efflux system protein